MLDWLKANWFLFVALIVVGSSWGQTTAKIKTLEDAIKDQRSTAVQIQQLQTQNATIDERTKIMMQMLEQMQRAQQMQVRFPQK